jgi:hypothetical protein
MTSRGSQQQEAYLGVSHSSKKAQNLNPQPSTLNQNSQPYSSFPSRSTGSLVAPFDVAIIMLSLCFLVISTTWPRLIGASQLPMAGGGDQEVGSAASKIGVALRMLRRDPSILILGTHNLPFAHNQHVLIRLVSTILDHPAHLIISIICNHPPSPLKISENSPRKQKLLITIPNVVASASSWIPLDDRNPISL